MSRAHREVYTKGKPKLDHLAADSLDPDRKPLRSNNNNNPCHPERTGWVRALLEAREEKGFFRALSRRPMALDCLQCAV